MVVRIKKLVPEAVVPVYAHASDAGLDLVAVSKGVNKPLEYIEYGTGLAVAIPDGHVGLVFPRSSISDTAMMLTNSVGVIDSGYRGEVKARFRCFDTREYKVGDRVAQLIILPIPSIEFQEVADLETTERAEAGFGSTGN